MKTAISIPDNIFTKADTLAQQLDISRSALYSRAIADYISRYSAEEVTRQLDQVYALESARPEPGLAAQPARVSRADVW